jgi:hypothetical protein
VLVIKHQEYMGVYSAAVLILRKLTIKRTKGL